MNTSPNHTTYPIIVEDTSDVAEQGLTKREYLAAAAMQGFCSNITPPLTQIGLQRISEASVMMADSLIAELNKA